MKRMLMVLLLITLLIVIVGCASDTADEPAGDDPAEDVAADEPTDDPADEEEDYAAVDEDLDAVALIADNCTSCHGDAQIYRDRNTDRWPGIVSSMAARTSLTEDETEASLVYLQENYSN